MQVMPELQKLCGVVVMPPCANEVKNDLHKISVVACPSSQALGSEKSDVVDAAVNMLVAPFRDGVAMWKLEHLQTIFWVKRIYNN
jgi:hypothetical protein